MLGWCLELIGDESMTREIMEAKEQEQLLKLSQKITLPDDLVQQWSDGLKRILHESNLAKVLNANGF